MTRMLTAALVAALAGFSVVADSTGLLWLSAAPEPAEPFWTQQGAGPAVPRETAAIAALRVAGRRGAAADQVAEAE